MRGYEEGVYMALDAVAVSALVDELQCLVGGRVDKVHQPERD